jgi:hypothetical protein
MVFVDIDIRVGHTCFQEAFFDFPAGQILTMQNPAMGMASLPPQGETFASGVVVLLAELNSVGKEAFYEEGTGFNHTPDDLFVAEAVTGVQGVLDMVFEVVGGRNSRSDPSLGIVGIALPAFFFGHNPHCALLGSQQRELKTSDSRTHNKTPAAKRVVICSENHQILHSVQRQGVAVHVCKKKRIKAKVFPASCRKQEGQWKITIIQDFCPPGGLNREAPKPYPNPGPGYHNSNFGRLFES